MFSAMQDRNKATVRAFYAAIPAAAFGELLDPAFATGFAATIADLRTAFPDLRYTVDELVAEGDRVAARFSWTGTSTAPFRGNPATGGVVTSRGMAIFELRDGRITGAALETDRLGFLEQLGVIAPRR